MAASPPSSFSGMTAGNRMPTQEQLHRRPMHHGPFSPENVDGAESKFGFLHQKIIACAQNGLCFAAYIAAFAAQCPQNAHYLSMIIVPI